MNNGTPQSVAWLNKELPQVEITIIQNEKNLGFVQATNRGLMQVKPSEHALLLNDDTQMVHPQWLNQMLETLTAEKSVGAVGPVSNYVMGWQHIQYSGALPLVHETRFLIGFCLLIKNSALVEVGLLDERFGMGMNEDTDYSLRLAEAGYTLKVDRRSFVLHFGSTSLTRLDKSFGRQEQETRQMLVNKWGHELVEGLFAPMEVSSVPA